MNNQPAHLMERVSEMNSTEALANALAILHARLPGIAERWQASAPFHYVIVDDFLPLDLANAIHDAYPSANRKNWDTKAYIHQKNKLTMRSGFPQAIAEFFEWSGTDSFKRWISKVTGIDDLIHDPELVGGGLHEILRGGFLDVHVDYNFHPVHKTHRRMNLLVYMNKDWKAEYQGALELWDMKAKRKIENIAPIFNRAVLFETNEISYHGHPLPLRVPEDKTRNSLAMYYYTSDRPEVAAEHNTLYVQTTGLRGRAKSLATAFGALVENGREAGVAALAKKVARKVTRKLGGRLPENG